MFAMRELSGPLSLLIEMVTYVSFCNEPFSLGVLQLLKVKLTHTHTPVRGVNQSVLCECVLCDSGVKVLSVTDPVGNCSSS